jgi:hypothetical protein
MGSHHVALRSDVVLAARKFSLHVKEIQYLRINTQISWLIYIIASRKLSYVMWLLKLPDLHENGSWQLFVKYLKYFFNPFRLSPVLTFEGYGRTGGAVLTGYPQGCKCL